MRFFMYRSYGLFMKVQPRDDLRKSNTIEKVIKSGGIFAVKFDPPEFTIIRKKHFEEIQEVSITKAISWLVKRLVARKRPETVEPPLVVEVPKTKNIVFNQLRSLKLNQSIVYSIPYPDFTTHRGTAKFRAKFYKAFNDLGRRPDDTPKFSSRLSDDKKSIVITRIAE